ncbi:MAG TPA: dihydropteroate synthase [Methylomirabilota bacterium]
MTTPIRAALAGVHLGDGLPVAVMGALNVSPGSFYAGSVVAGGDDLLRAAERMAREGASLLDVGAMSTAPYLSGSISASEEAERLGWAVGILASKLGVPVSADTSRAEPARAALGAGAAIINDVRGLTADPALAPLVAGAGAGLIIMASERGGAEGQPPVDAVMELLEESLRIAIQAGISDERIVVDPGIGFFRRRGIAWHEWDCEILAALGRLRDLDRPVCVGVSRKSFVGEIAGEADPGRRLPGSLAAVAAAVLGGANLIRAHDVGETVQAVRVAEAIRRSREGG